MISLRSKYEHDLNMRVAPTAIRAPETFDPFNAERNRTPVDAASHMICALWTQRIYPALKIAMVADALVADGFPIEEALTGTRLSEAQLRSPKTRVSVNQVIEVYRNAVRLSKDPFFALRTGLKTHVAAYGMYGFAILSSTSFRDTMQFVVRYHQLANPLVRIRFSETTNMAAWTIEPIAHPAIDRRLYRFIVELQFGVHISLHRDVMGPTFAPAALLTTFDAARAETDTADILGVPCLGDKSENQILFESRWLDEAPPFGNDLVHATVKGLCEELKADLKQRAGFSRKVYEVLFTAPNKRTDFEAAAALLRIPPRTLRRRLNEEGTSYSKIVSELKTAMAIKYLRDTDMTVEDIASALGFSDTSSFRQAFRRAAGTSPHEFRRLLK